MDSYTRTRSGLAQLKVKHFISSCRLPYTSRTVTTCQSGNSRNLLIYINKIVDENTYLDI